MEKRALRFCIKGQRTKDKDDILYDEAVDKTGTVDTSELTESSVDSLGEEYQKQLTTTILEQEGIKGIEYEVLEVHGWAPGRKADGTSRLIYENCDGIPNNIGGNAKLDKAKEIIDNLEADAVVYNEHKMNCSHKLNRNGMSQMFNGGNCEVRSVVGHNIHEKAGGRTQEGGTSILLYGQLIHQHDFEASGKDDTGLGRWVSMVLRGSDRVTTRFVCGYNPCHSAKKATRSSYQQQRRYFITQEKDRTCPRKRFRNDLVNQLVLWRKQSDRLIVCMDVNEDIYLKSTGKALRRPRHDRSGGQLHREENWSNIFQGQETNRLCLV